MSLAGSAAGLVLGGLIGYIASDKGGEDPGLLAIPGGVLGFFAGGAIGLALSGPGDENSEAALERGRAQVRRALLAREPAPAPAPSRNPDSAHFTR